MASLRSHRWTRGRALLLALAVAILSPAHATGAEAPPPLVPVAPEPPPAGPYPFTDIASSAFTVEIAWLYTAGITGGCRATNFCPVGSVTREQMASFLVRALDLASTTRDFFTDDDTSIHEDDINRLAAAGVTGGCAAARYCPRAVVTREQMASFLVRALELPDTAADYFVDDGASIHQADINRLASSGITGGCSVGRYCPGASVTREQMAAFMFRGLATFATAAPALPLTAPPSAPLGTGGPYPSVPISQLACEGGSVYATSPRVEASTVGAGGLDAYVWWHALLYAWDGVAWTLVDSSGWYWSLVHPTSPGAADGVAGPTWYPERGGPIVSRWIYWNPAPGSSYAIAHVVADADGSTSVAVSYTASTAEHWCAVQ